MLILVEFVILFYCIIFALSFGGAYDKHIEDLTSTSVGDCQAPHPQLKTGVDCFIFMDFGAIFEKLEEDSRNLLITALLCFPIAYIDCWIISPSFSGIDLVPQIILAIGIGLLLAFGGILNNLFYLILSNNLNEPIYPWVSITPCYSTSIVVLLQGRNITPVNFELIFTGLCILSAAIALFTRIRKNRYKKKGSNERDTDSDNL